LNVFVGVWVRDGVGELDRVTGVGVCDGVADADTLSRLKTKPEKVVVMVPYMLVACGSGAGKQQGCADAFPR
jgi:hypothetical protein